MNTRQAFLSEIIAHPEDSATRLIFADWLHDNGEADRAEFIRAQLRLDGMPKREPDRFDLAERALDLLSAHWDEWTADLPPAARQVELTFRGGFVDEAIMPPAQFLACGEALVATAPLQRLTLLGLGSRPGDLARLPALLGLREVSLHSEHLGPDVQDAAPFLDEWRPSRLRHLTLRNEQTVGDLLFPLDWPGYQGLESLSLERMGVADEDAAAVVQRAGKGRLHQLTIGGHEAGEQTILAVCRHDRLRALDLWATGTPTATEVFNSTCWTQLRTLKLAGLQTREAELRAMTATPWFSRLCSLEMIDTPFNASAALANAPAGVSHLGLLRTPEKGDGLAGLLDGDFAAGLTSLDLQESVPTAALTPLAISRRLGELRRLTVSPQTGEHIGLSLDLLCGVVESPHLPWLTHLAGAGWDGHWLPTDAERFAGLSGLARLRSLKLWGCRLTEAGVRALARSPYLSGLRRLSIDARGGDRCLPALLEAPWLASLRELWFQCKGINDAQLQALVSNPAVSRLRVLHLGPQPITRAGIEALATSPYLGGLLYLNVGNHSASDDLYSPMRERFGGRFAGCY